MSTQEFIEVIGANENNLRDVSVRIPKRTLTVFTGVSGSGKSSLVFDTVAAEAQRLLNETYPGFIQGFMQSPPRPDVAEIRGLTAAIVVGQEPMAANTRSTFGTATDITPALRVLFSRLAEPSLGGPAAYSFNIPSVSGQGALEVNGKKEVRSFSRTGGMCPECKGTGTASDIDLSQLVDESLSLNEGAIIYPGMKVGSWQWKAYAESGLYPADKPVGEFTEEEKHALFHLSDVKVKVGGVNMSYLGLVARLKANVLSRPIDGLQKHMREFVERAVVFVDCPACEGTRLAQHARESFIEGKSIADACDMELTQLAEWLSGINHPAASIVAESVGHAIDIGLGYLSLSRATSTLSGGEAQRTRMVRHLGSPLSDVTYVFDEPTTGLHQQDAERMNELLLRLRDKGNTVLVVEHNPSTIGIADHIVDIGPAAGANGGRVVFEGTPAQLKQASTLSAQHLGDAPVLKAHPRQSTGTLEVDSLRRNNLRDVAAAIPLGVLTAITGVAGSGKSSFVAALPKAILERAVVVSQGPIKGSRRSTPATYTGAMDPIRKAFAKAHGVSASLFSANSEGACPHCSGAGLVYVDLGAMEGMEVPCEVCEGRRFSEEVLGYQLAGQSIADVMELAVEEARGFFAENKIPAARKVCEALVAVGLNYISLGQAMSTLSGGERQRLKLALFLLDKKDDRDIVILDEPSAGLHLADIAKLLELLDHLVDTGHTVLCVEHHLSVIAHADWVIDIGPGAGSRGGTVVAECSPLELSEHPQSVTGRYLARYSA